MLRKRGILGLMVLVLVLLISFAEATPLSLNYSVSDLGGGLYNYEFALVLDNHDNSWALGQGWNWLIFGFAPRSVISPLTDFVGDSNDLPVGPWTQYTTSQHSGYPYLYPTFLSVTNYPVDLGWVPISIGETLTWSGTSTANVPQGQLLFSTLQTRNGAVRADFEVAHLSSAVPEPATMLLFGAGLAGLGIMRKRFKG